MAAARAKEEFEQFERRAALAEEQIKLLSQRVEFLEKVSTETTTASASSSTDLAQQSNLLDKVKELEQSLEAEKKLADTAQAERDEARAALRKVEKESASNAYRITILLNSLKEMELRNPATPL